MKNWFLPLLAICSLVGCASAPTYDGRPSVNFAASLPSNAHQVWCHDNKSEACYEAAGVFCRSETGSTKWHSLAEPGFIYPVMLQDGDSWRMLIVCKE
jgi:hypothetical protein